MSFEVESALDVEGVSSHTGLALLEIEIDCLRDDEAASESSFSAECVAAVLLSLLMSCLSLVRIEDAEAKERAGGELVPRLLFTSIPASEEDFVAEAEKL